MNHTKVLLTVAILSLLAFLSGCVMITPVPNDMQIVATPSQSTPAPTNSPTAIPTVPPVTELKTTVGVLEIKQVEFADRYPPNCTPDPYYCHQAVNGRRMLIIWLDSQDEQPVTDFASLAEEIIPSTPTVQVLIGTSGSGLSTIYHLEEEIYSLDGQTSGVHIISDNSFTTGPFMGGADSRQLFVAFQVSTAANNFTLIWPGNPPIELE